MANPLPFPEIDGNIHEPARLRILALLAVVEEADFMYILRQAELSRGNLSVQVSKLEKWGYVELERRIDGERMRTSYRLTAFGKSSLSEYRKAMGAYLDCF